MVFTGSFLFFCPAGANHCTDWGHIWQAKFDPNRLIFRDFRSEKRQEIANFGNFFAPQG